MFVYISNQVWFVSCNNQIRTPETMPRKRPQPASASRYLVFSKSLNLCDICMQLHCDFVSVTYSVALTVSFWNPCNRGLQRFNICRQRKTCGKGFFLSSFTISCDWMNIKYQTNRMIKSKLLLTLFQPSCQWHSRAYGRRTFKWKVIIQSGLLFTFSNISD